MPGSQIKIKCTSYDYLDWGSLQIGRGRNQKLSRFLGSRNSTVSRRPQKDRVVIDWDPKSRVANIQRKNERSADAESQVFFDCIGEKKVLDKLDKHKELQGSWRNQKHLERHGDCRVIEMGLEILRKKN